MQSRTPKMVKDRHKIVRPKKPYAQLTLKIWKLRFLELIALVALVAHVAPVAVLGP